MSKPVCVVSCPIDCYSGYSSRSRDFVRELVRVKGGEWDIKVLPQRWGGTPWGYIEDHIEEWGWLNPHIINQLTQQPDYWFQITIPNEFQAVGKWNCGVTAGIETTIPDISWVEGCNKMNLVITSSQFAKDVFTSCKYEKRNQQTGATIEITTVNAKIETLFEGLDTKKFFHIPYDKTQGVAKDGLTDMLNSIPESFCFLTVGHWMQGDIGEDRKNIGLTVLSFLETFKNQSNSPGLILKVSKANPSIIDRDDILERISKLRSRTGNTKSGIYLLHGELTEGEVNELYNHPKVKAMVSLTKGEGWGRPLMEFTQTKKPIAVSAWSAHLEFLSPTNTFLVAGTLEKVHPSSTVKNIIIPDAKWFSPGPIEVNRMWKTLFKDYKKFLEPAKIQAHKIKTEFTLEKMGDRLNQLLKDNAPEFKPLTLPKLSDIQVKLPELKKIEL